MEVMNNIGCIGCSNKDNLCNLFAPIKDEETFADIFQRCFKIKIKTDTKYICTQCRKILIEFDIFLGNIKRNLFGVTNKNDQLFRDVEYLDESVFNGGHLIRNDATGTEVTSSVSDDKGNPKDGSKESYVKSEEELKYKGNCDENNETGHTLVTIKENIENVYNAEASNKGVDTITKETSQISKPKSLEQFFEVEPVNRNGSIIDDDIQPKSEDGEIDGSIIGYAVSERAYDEFDDMDAVSDVVDGDFDDIDEEYAVQTLDDTTCVYCGVSLGTASLVEAHVTSVHALDPRTGEPLRECPLCGVTITHSYRDHYNRCHNNKNHLEAKEYQCLFCDNVYTHMKGYFTHIRMKHGVKLTNDKTPKYFPRDRQKCHLCERDFSQKQILNKHLLKVHGYEVEKRKAYVCPICSERVSYGVYFTDHLLHKHNITEDVEQLEFLTMDDFMLFKAAIQEDTKVRYRKTTASKATIEGVRSHYMCSQSGVYVYQGKGKRPAPERQIYKTGKACPAHMVVTQTSNRVLVVFHKTHIGHGVCPYYEPRQTFSAKKKRMMKSSTITETCDSVELKEDDAEEMSHLVCDSCGMMFADTKEFRIHSLSHKVMYSCQCCGQTFSNVELWERHVRMVHGIKTWY